MKCEVCGKPLSPHAKGVYRRVEGWERNRTAGEGVHPLKDREFKNRYAHELCLEIRSHGGKQESLLA